MGHGFPVQFVIQVASNRINYNMNKAIQLSAIVPFYNEEGSITAMYDALRKALDPLSIPYELLFVDDGSHDRTFEIAKALAQKDPNLRVIKFRKNYGQTPAMMAGINHARGKILITMDGDLQNDPADIPSFLSKIEEGYDIVVGWRHKRQDKLITRKIPSKIANWLIGKITGVPIKDNGCSLKAYKANIIKNIPMYSEMHRFIPAMLSLSGAKIAEIKVRHHARRFGESKYGLSRIFKVLSDLLTIKTLISLSSRPLLWFGYLSLPGFVVGLLLSAYSIFRITLDPEASILIPLGTGVIFFAFGFFLLSCGVLCELIYRTGNLKVEMLANLTANVTAANKGLIQE